MIYKLLELLLKNRNIGNILKKSNLFQKFYNNIRSIIADKIILKFPVYGSEMHKSLILKSWDPVRYSTIALALNTIKQEKIEGSLAEFGVYRGETSKIIHKISPNKKFFLFDTFEGFPEEFIEDNENLNRFSETRLEVVKKNLGDLTNIDIRKGIFPETTKGLENEIFSFVYIDVDLYKSTIEGLKFFYPRTSEGGYIIIHDYNNPLESNSGVLRATKEFMEDKKEKIIEIPDFLGSVIFRKL